MRKYRAYHHKYGMINDVSRGQHHGGMYFPFGFNVGDSLDSAIGWTVMISTGLNDKNGVEIFEGDVLMAENEKLYTFKYSPEHLGFVAEDMSGEDLSDSQLQTNKVEIVGHVFEMGGEL